MIKLVNLKKNLGKKLKIVRTKLKTSPKDEVNEKIENEETASFEGDLHEPDSTISPYNEVVSNVCFHFDGKVDVKEIYDYVRNVFEIPQNEHEKALEEARCAYLAFKFESIIEHSQLMLKCAQYDFQKSKLNRNGTSETPASVVLVSHSNMKNLNTVDVSFAKWIVLSEIQSEVNFDPEIFLKLIHVITEPVGDDTAKLRLKTENLELTSLFYQSSEKFWSSALNFIESLPVLKDSDVEMNNAKLLSVMRVLKKLLLCDTIGEAGKSFDQLISNSIALGVSKYLHITWEQFNELKKKSKESVMGMNQFAIIACNKFPILLDAFDGTFKELCSFDFRQHLYKAFNETLEELLKPAVVAAIDQQTSNLMFHLRGCEKTQKLQELFMRLKKFSDLGLEIVPGCDFRMLKFFEWFSLDADHTCDVPVFGALARIKKAILMDNFEANDETTNNSSSAVDVLGILDSILKFWESLRPTVVKDLPTHEFIDFVANDICRFTLIYCNLATKQVKNLKSVNDNPVRFLREVCAVINNMSFVLQKLQTLMVSFITGIDRSNIKLPCAVKNILQLGLVKKQQLMAVSSEKLKPELRKLLEEHATQDKKKSHAAIEMQVDIEKTLQEHLTAADYKKAKKVVLDLFISVIGEMVNECDQAKASALFCANLQRFLENVELVFNDVDGRDAETQEVCDSLEYLSLETPLLIHRYYTDRYEVQKSLKSLGSAEVLLVEAVFDEKILKLTIWNAKNLNDEFSETYVKFNILPEEIFPLHQNLKTKICTSSQFALYEESFEKELTDEQLLKKYSIIHFTVKGRNRLNANKTLGEAFLSFKDIQTLSTSPRSSLQQFSLQLTQRLEDDKVIRILDQRSNLSDEKAFEFLNKGKGKEKALKTASKIFDDIKMFSKIKPVEVQKSLQ